MEEGAGGADAKVTRFSFRRALESIAGWHNRRPTKAPALIPLCCQSSPFQPVCTNARGGLRLRLRRRSWSWTWWLVRSKSGEAAHLEVVIYPPSIRHVCATSAPCCESRSMTEYPRVQLQRWSSGTGRDGTRVCDAIQYSLRLSWSPACSSATRSPLPLWSSFSSSAYHLPRLHHRARPRQCL